MLELICRTTNMGFAAVARVTENRWIACAVQDEIGFGLKPGGELQLETTICNEIRGHGQPVIIDEVAKDKYFFNHHTPKMYGFQSYISIPIFLKSGQFFGTLCAIDPKPLPLKAGNMVTMFNLFADLIAFHLHNQDQQQAKALVLNKAQQDLAASRDDVRQYEHVSRHSLQEPLRKLQVFTDMIVHDVSLPPEHRVRDLAVKINRLSGDLSAKINRLNELADMQAAPEKFTKVDLQEVVANVLIGLRTGIKSRQAVVTVHSLPVVAGIAGQLEIVLYHIIDNALRYSQGYILPIIDIFADIVDAGSIQHAQVGTQYRKYHKVCIRDNGIGIEGTHLEKIFDLFVQLKPKAHVDSVGVGLSQARRIMRQHDGVVLVESVEGKGSVFSLLFPVIVQDEDH